MAKRITIEKMDVELQVLSDLLMRRYKEKTPEYSFEARAQIVQGYMHNFMLNIMFDGGSKASMIKKIQERALVVRESLVSI